MRGFSLPLMAVIAMAVFSISCTPERELFSDTVVKEEVSAAPVGAGPAEMESLGAQPVIPAERSESRDLL